ncbi:hypothetical protein M422DRAFT_270886 [Sphaerobolus stellatus SS14]|uniref:Uncharacterized protein n=1 Tax=Sphaerobolus stellatus (strain SS14) TaxID=990650 RepID=A0A0C9URL4_SPHS4|nr:hypothetical protein M422DRAFT_270886 [Sphaerobolus stellatus SS14]
MARRCRRRTDHLRALFRANACVLDEFETSTRRIQRFRRDCMSWMERGIKGGVQNGYHRMEMARLLGRLGLPPAPDAATKLLQKVTSIFSLESPHPTYVYALLLLGVLTVAKIDARNIVSLIPQGSSPTTETCSISNALPTLASLSSNATPTNTPSPCNTTLSRPNQSKPKRTRRSSNGSYAARKAASTKMSVEFAMGYYADVRIGGWKDLEAVRGWTQHDFITNNKLARRRAQAQAIAAGRVSETKQEVGGMTPAERVEMEAMKYSPPSQYPPQGPPPSQYPSQGRQQQQHPPQQQQQQAPPPSQHPLPPRNPPPPRLHTTARPRRVRTATIQPHLPAIRPLRHAFVSSRRNKSPSSNSGGGGGGGRQLGKPPGRRHATAAAGIQHQRQGQGLSHILSPLAGGPGTPPSQSQGQEVIGHVLQLEEVASNVNHELAVIKPVIDDAFRVGGENPRRREDELGIGLDRILQTLIAELGSRIDTVPLKPYLADVAMNC